MDETLCWIWRGPALMVEFREVFLIPCSVPWNVIRAQALWDSCLHDVEFTVYFSAMNSAEVCIEVVVRENGVVEMSEAERLTVVKLELVAPFLVVSVAKTEELGYPCGGACVTPVGRGQLIRASLSRVEEPVEMALTVSARSPSEVSRVTRMSLERAVVLSRLRRWVPLEELAEVEEE